MRVRASLVFLALALSSSSVLAASLTIVHSSHCKGSPNPDQFADLKAIMKNACLGKGEVGHMVCPVDAPTSEDDAQTSDLQIKNTMTNEIRVQKMQPLSKDIATQMILSRPDSKQGNSAGATQADIITEAYELQRFNPETNQALTVSIAEILQKQVEEGKLTGRLADIVRSGQLDQLLPQLSSHTSFSSNGDALQIQVPGGGEAVTIKLNDIFDQPNAQNSQADIDLLDLQQKKNSSENISLLPSRGLTLAHLKVREIHRLDPAARN